MSIHPSFAQAILEGTKTVEFRKRPIADDVTHVVIYVTRPVASVVGIFAVGDQITTSPEDLWTQFEEVAGIAKDKFFEYYQDKQQGTGIQVNSVHPFPKHESLVDALGIARPPQSYQYLDDDLGRRALDMAMVG